MNKKIIILLIILLIALFGYVVINREKKNSPFEKEVNSQNPNMNLNSQNTVSTNTEYMTYTHPSLGFTFTHSVNFSIGLQEEDVGEILLIQKKSGGTIGQIYISAFPKKQKLTAELITKEFPGKKIIIGKKVLIGGVESFSFESEEEGVGKTWEVVFAKDGYIYQAMCNLESRSEFETVLTSWEF